MVPSVLTCKDRHWTRLIRYVSSRRKLVVNSTSTGQSSRCGRSHRHCDALSCASFTETLDGGNLVYACLCEIRNRLDPVLGKVAFRALADAAN